jgi:thymidylate synthase (FAD)
LVEVAARTCYDSFRAGRPHAEHVAHLIESLHGSCLEHAAWCFLFTGVSRSLSHELVRHRQNGVSQRSQRYVNEDDAAFVEPPEIAADPELHALWLSTVEQSQKAYTALAGRLAVKIEDDARNGPDLDHPLLCGRCFGLGRHVRFVSGLTTFRLDPVDPAKPDAPCPSCSGTGLEKGAKTTIRKAARQAARSVLPNACETRVFLTANARALRNMLEQRCSEGAEPEIRRLFCKVYELAVAEAPNLFGDYRRRELPDGSFALETDHRKV